VHRLPDQTLAQRARAAIDGAFAAGVAPSEAADFAELPPALHKQVDALLSRLGYPPLAPPEPG
jgi:hypothetical protein